MIYAVNKRTKEHKNITACSDAEYQYIYCDKKDWEVIFTDADGWIEWSGGECPLPDGVKYDVRCASGSESRQRNPEGDNWLHEHGDSNIIAYRPIIDQPASEEVKEWEPAEGEPARTIGGDCMVLAIDRERNKAAVQWHDGELGVVNIEAIKKRPTPREQWIYKAQKHCTEFSSKQLGHIHDALASGELEMPGE